MSSIESSERTRGSCLILGGGGRGHVYAKAYGNSGYFDEIVVVGGDPFMQNDVAVPVITYPDMKPHQVRAIPNLIEWHDPTFVVPSQDDWIANGAADISRGMGRLTFAPSMAASQVEWSKLYSRLLNEEAGIAQPGFVAFINDGTNSHYEQGRQYMREHDGEAKFVKADGLGAGKLAFPAETAEEGIMAIDTMESDYPEQSQIFLIEDWARNHDGTNGVEASTFAYVNGAEFILVRSAMDFKRRFDEQDRRVPNPNTGSMGSISPTYIANLAVEQYEKEQIIQPKLDALMRRGRPYVGVLYESVIVLTRQVDDAYQNPIIEEIVEEIEVNGRDGDPEAHTTMPSITVNVAQTHMAVARGDMASIPRDRYGNLPTDDRYRVVIAGVLPPYPGDIKSWIGRRVYGVNAARRLPHVAINGGGIHQTEDGDHFAIGGRVIYAAGDGDSPEAARNFARAAMDEMGIEDDNGNRMPMPYRLTIGQPDIDRFPR